MDAVARSGTVSGTVSGAVSGEEGRTDVIGMHYTA
jgi:hypothetical protein